MKIKGCITNHSWNWICLFWIIGLYYSNSVVYARKRANGLGYRLPDHVVPKKYTLEIITNFDDNDFSFQGKVWIRLHCVKATNKIILHSKDLTILEKDVTLNHVANGATVGNDTILTSIPVINHHYAIENDFYIVMLSQRLIPGNIYIFHIPFKGLLTEGLNGYYRSTYFDNAANTTKWLAVTQFEPTDARRAFPCFDEPAIKSQFLISLGHSPDFKAISNMPLVESTSFAEKDGWIIDKFEETVPMSTYLVAYMVSEFDYREAENRDAKDVKFRIWARKEAINQVELARNTGPKVLNYFEKYFDIDYPLPKLDMCAIPDFSAGAMENWGLITYRETALLYDPKKSSIFSKHGIASVVSHELAHQWFGNLVTMKWWTDLWLNEGFATYVGALGVHYVFPEWKSFDSTIVNDLLTVFSLDALKSSHPVLVPIGHPSEIDQIFDTISYKKGSYLLHMMNSFLGENVFQKGITSYLKQHRYSNAAQDDLWDSLTQMAHAMGALDNSVTVKMIMDTWTLQTGYPVVTVERDYGAGTAILSQERYLSSNSVNDDKKTKSECWWIPLSFTTSRELKFNDSRPQTWLTCDGPISISPLPGAGDDQWIIFNIKAAGLYRVNYDLQNWMLLGKTLNDEKEYKVIDTLNRVQLLADMLGLAWVGRLEYKVAFDILRYLRHENEYLPWMTAMNMLENINSMLLRSSAYGYFKEFMKNMLEPSYAKLSKITDVPRDYEGIKQHSLIVSSSCYYGVSDCEDQTQQLFKAWFSEGNPDEDNPIPKDLRKVVYCQALKRGGEKYWQFLWERYQKSNVATDKSLILGALGCVKDVWILKRYLTWSLDPMKIRKQDSVSVFTSVAYNEVGYFVAKEFFIKSFMELHKYHQQKASRLGRYVKAIAEQITTVEDFNELQSFIQSMEDELKESELAVKQGIESANNNLAWHSIHFNTVSQYFITTPNKTE